MSYTNFAYYFAPHGWYPRHDPYKFIMQQYYARVFRCSDAVNKYLNRRILMELQWWQDELNRLHRASRYRGFRPLYTPAMSINHMRDDDNSYYDDELAASAGL